MNAPAITVLMPVRDGARYVRDSIDSILNQTFRDFELVVVDDGSTDATPEILGAVSAADQRVRVLRQDREGLVAALNRGIAAASAPLIARLDADDVAMPNRLARQLAVMSAHPELGLLGSHANIIDADGRTIGRLSPVTRHDELTAVLRRSNPMIHSTVIFRKQLVLDLGGFRAPFEAAEDYDLWLRISERAQIANLPEPLIRYRRHATAVSARVGVRSAFSVRLAKRSASLRQAGLPDPANDLIAPPDWRQPPPEAFYAQDARVFSLLEFANPELARSLTLDHLDPAVFKGLPRHLDHGERKIAQRALLNIIARPDRLPRLDRIRLWATFAQLHPFRAAKIFIKEHCLTGVRRNM
jgi:hypothetical protein